MFPYLLTSSIFLIAFSWLYFRLANKYNIIDKPNNRSSHTTPIIRGAGIIFPIAIFFGLINMGQLKDYWQFSLGLLAISIISFLDDVLTLPNRYRLLVQFASVALLLFSIDTASTTNVLWLIPAFIVVVGSINAYNFMDGINGIHVLYSIAGFIGFLLVGNEGYEIFPTDVLWSLMISFIIFSFLNLRKSAKCFSGDVGSVSVAFIFSFIILQLMFETNDLKWILMFGIYGLDSVGTIILRLIRRENIFQAHRSHFYQFLANERRMPHVAISMGYAALQILLNISLIYFSNAITAMLCFVILASYVALRLSMEGREKLFVKYN